MNNLQFKTNEATDFITKALDDFLRDKRLKLTTQQYDKLKKLLMVKLLEEDDMSYGTTYSHLTDIVEYRKDYEINVNALDEAEEEMIRIIGAADIQEKEIIVETSKYKKRFYITLCLLSFVCAGLLLSLVKQYFDHQKIEMLASAQVIDVDEENVIKDLVQQLVTKETKNGHEITHSAIYKDIKDLESIQSLGSATSYKKFNKAQYDVAVQYLKGRIGGTN